MTINILALGNRFSAAYTSLEHELMAHGNVSYHSEHDFKRVDDAIRYVRNSAFHVVVMPNPYGNTRRLGIYQQLKILNFPVITFDRGALPDSWFFDTGFNADSDAYHPLYWDKPLENAAQTEQYISKIKQGEQALEAQGARLGGDTLKQRLGIAQDKKVLFVPFQRPGDTVITYFSDGYDAFVTAIEMLNRSIEKNLFDEWILLAKKHPLETKRPSEQLLFVDDDVNIYDLIEAADLIVLINSGVGLLAQLWEKPVLYFGRVFYGHPKLNLPVRSYMDILYHMRALPRPDRETMLRLIAHLRDSVYSFARFETELVRQKDGAYRNVTRFIDFYHVQFPDVTQWMKKKILFITQVIPWPINRGSAQRTDQMLRALLNNGYTVDVIVSNRSERAASSSAIEERLRKRYPHARFFVRKHPSLLNNKPKFSADYHRYLLYLKSLVTDYLTLARYKTFNANLMPGNIRNTVTRQLKQARYDAVYCNYLYTFPVGIKKYGADIIADIHDLQYRRIENDVIPAATGIEKFLYRKLFRHSEMKHLDAVDKVISISPEETQLIRTQLPHKVVYTLPATADTPPPTPAAAHAYDLTFIGSNSDANRDSLLWFLTTCMGTLARENSAIRFLIQGRITRNKRLHAHAVYQRLLNRNIFVSDFAENLSNVYRDTKVIICPVIKGSGMKIKVIEALAHGKAIVGTDVAFEGINITNEALVANSESAFVAEVLGILADAQRRERLERAAVKLYRNEHAFEGCVKAIKTIVEADA